MSADEARRRFAAARVARLATASADGTPHLVPMTFAVVDDHIYSAVDGKPKSARSLRRLANIEANPTVSVLVDEYDDDWSRLWWARADGTARVVEVDDGPGGLTALRDRYPAYRGESPAGPLLVVDVERWSGWRAG